MKQDYTTLADVSGAHSPILTSFRISLDRGRMLSAASAHALSRVDQPNIGFDLPVAQRYGYTQTVSAFVPPVIE